jgi:cytochrome c-type biogenesis protein CcmH/NrfG
MFAATLVVIASICFSSYFVVCDVDPTDANSILMEQLKLQRQQNMILQQQNELHQRQISLLIESNTQGYHQPILIPTFVAICSAAGGWLVVYALKHLVQRFRAPNPGMPQTMQLMDLAEPSDHRSELIERLRSVLQTKSPAPTEWLSGESSPA